MVSEEVRSWCGRGGTYVVPDMVITLVEEALAETPTVSVLVVCWAAEVEPEEVGSAAELEEEGVETVSVVVLCSAVDVVL